MFTPAYIIYPVLMTLAVYLVARAMRTKAHPKTLEQPMSGDPASYAPSTEPSETAKTAKTANLSPREEREVQNLERIKTGKCRYCEETATEQFPARVQIKPILDPVYRRFGLHPVAQYKIVLQRDPSIHKDCLCGMHADMARAHLEQHTSEHQTDYAQFEVKRRGEMFEYERYALDERMRDDAEQLKKGKKKKTGPEQQGQLLQFNGKKKAAGE